MIVERRVGRAERKGRREGLGDGRVEKGG